MKSEPSAESPRWHQLDTHEVVQLLDTHCEQGLTAGEVTRRQKHYGPNSVSAKAGTPAWKRFLLQFHQPLVYILLLAVGTTAALQEWVDSGVIFGVVLINAIIGFIQESKAEKAIDALSRMILTEATVRRDGRRQRIPSVELVPGDVVLLQSGDRIPADLRLFTVNNLQIDESALTGESLPVTKHADPLTGDVVLADRKNQAYAGTLVTYGTAEGLVWAIGDKTETGRIAWLIAEATDISTPLTQKIAAFSKLLLWVILALAVITFSGELSAPAVEPRSRFIVEGAVHDAARACLCIKPVLIENLDQIVQVLRLHLSEHVLLHFSYSSGIYSVGSGRGFGEDGDK